MKHSTGVKRLDDLLRGGIPRGSVVIVHGPPFIGKEVLARSFLLAGMKQGIPGVMVLTGTRADDVRKQFEAMDPTFLEHEKNGLAYFVDAYSRSIGAESAEGRIDYVESLSNLNALAQAVNETERKVTFTHPAHNLVLDSISTISVYSEPRACFRFLQVLIGKAQRAGATTLLLLDEGMHTPAEIEMFKHLADGNLEVQRENERAVLHAEGLGIHEGLGWFEYHFTDDTFELTGSLAGGRIR